MSARPVPATIAQWAAWWCLFHLCRLHVALAKWHCRQAEAVRDRCPWLIWGKVELHRLRG